MTDYYKDCAHCGTSVEERMEAVVDNGHKSHCLLYVRYPCLSYKQPIDVSTLRKLHTGYDY